MWERRSGEGKRHTQAPQANVVLLRGRGREGKMGRWEEGERGRGVEGMNP